MSLPTRVCTHLIREGPDAGKICGAAFFRNHPDQEVCSMHAMARRAELQRQRSAKKAAEIKTRKRHASISDIRRAASLSRKKFGHGRGVRSNKRRCSCKAMTLKRARTIRHRCKFAVSVATATANFESVRHDAPVVARGNLAVNI